MTQVHIEETPGGSDPRAKAEGDVLGYQTQLAEATAYAEQAKERVKRVQAENERRLADAHDNAVRAQGNIAALEGALANANDALAALEG